MSSSCATSSSCSISRASASRSPISTASSNRFPRAPANSRKPAWQKDSYCAQLIGSIKARQGTLTPDQWSDLDFATQYIFRKWPAFDERPRSSLEMTWSGMADKFLFNPFNRLFCSGKCSFTPEDTTHRGKIVICDFPLLEYGHETGRLINIILKLIFQRAWLRRKLSESANPVFLWQDEFQYFVTRRDNFFQQTCRGSRVAVVCLTQNILNLSEELGEAQPGSKTKSFCGNLAIKIAHQQNEPDTATFMADIIGKEYRYLDSYNAGGRQLPRPQRAWAARSSSSMSSSPSSSRGLSSPTPKTLTPRQSFTCRANPLTQPRPRAIRRAAITLRCFSRARHEGENTMMPTQNQAPAVRREYQPVPGHDDEPRL